jgi:hypothetical protein
MQLLVGDVLRRFLGVVGLEDDRGLVAARGHRWRSTQFAADVERAVLEPADIDVVVGEGRVLDLRVGLDPVERFPCSPQKASGLRTDSEYMRA